MKRILAIVLALVLFGGAIGGSIAWANTGEGPGGGAEEVNVDESYDGGEVEVAESGKVIVTLESNLSTGFRWELVENTDEGVLEAAGNKIYQLVDGPMPGAGGHEIWTFKALKKGTSTISMEYSRPWEGGEKGVQTFELTVVVE